MTSFNETILSLLSVMNSMGAILEKVCGENDDRITDDLLVEELFVGASVPDMPITEYLDRCVKYFKCSPCCFVSAIILIDRATTVVQFQGNKLVLHSLNVHRLFCTALTLACKYLEDRVYSNKYYAQVAGVSLKDLNRYEIQFAAALNFDLCVPVETFQVYFKQLTKIDYQMEAPTKMEEDANKANVSGTNAVIARTVKAKSAPSFGYKSMGAPSFGYGYAAHHDAQFERLHIRTARSA